ncbi:unnamed protein product [Phaedon cochleariae]|uniref:Uncharacterized protein n=1 Tax=Phaedon cochleariae TaxID=80249 RepID=A0A9P0DBG7_PHACE|nr:unnamed protein product [Phaedon cochleariae]
MTEHFGVPSFIRVTKVSGFEKRINDIVYCSPLKSTENSNVVIFFGGDVQDFTENMASHRDNKRHVKWNLENTAQLMGTKFVDCHIVVVRPVRMDYKTFSCYENFVPCAKCGVPDHTPMHNSLTHLEKLLSSLSQRLRSMTDEELNAAMEHSKNSVISDDSCESSSRHENLVPGWREQIDLQNCDIKLVGFSKGCVVLNQFLYEFQYYKTFSSDDSDTCKIISRIKQMYWLDGGHAGGKNTWITSKPLLETLANLRISIHVHVTPYQIKDDHRPWIRKEEKLFSETLKKFGAPVHRKIHFENDSPSLEMHFSILNEFMQCDADYSK